MAADSAGDLDWNLVRTFVAVADGGSLAAGARELGLAHPTVARHIQNLESALGYSLFHRRATGLALNDAGIRLLSAARGMLQGARAFEQASRAVSGRSSGLVRITASEFLADVFPGLISPLRRAGADRQINIELLIANDLLNLLQGEADIAIRHVQPRQQDLICRRLAGLPAGLYASRSYVAERGMPDLSSFQEHWFIDGVRTPRLARHARRLGYPMSKEQFVFRSDSFAGRLNGAEAGWGITVVPAHVAASRPGLVRVLTDVPFSEIEMWLVAREDVRTTPYLRDAFATAGDTLNAFAANLAAAGASAGGAQRGTAAPPSLTVSR
jgi:DNA-binding transcriptional LysR family regulator